MAFPPAVTPIEIVRRCLIAIVVASLACCLAACSGGDGDGPRPTSNPSGTAAGREGGATPVIAHVVRYDNETARVESIGTSRARASAMIFPETGGEVEAVLFEPGQFVHAGTPLLQLEAREETLRVRLARVQVRDAEQLLARYQRIDGTGAVSDSQIEEAQTALEAARIALEQAEVALEERTVRAPFDGHLGLSDIDAGARVTTSTQIVAIDDRAVLYVDFAVAEQTFGHIGAGDVISVESFAVGDTALQAEIVGIDSRIDASRRTYMVRAAIDNADDARRPGMSFRVAFDMPGRRWPVVPEAAILWGTDGAYVWAIRDGVARRVPIEIITRRPGAVLVRGDLPELSELVAEGVQKVREGAPVKVLGSPRGDLGDVGAAAGAALSPPLRPPPTDRGRVAS